MMNLILMPAAAILSAVLLGGCSPGNDKMSASEERAVTQTGEQTVTRTISGSAESPDPVLAEVRRLERQGVLEVVRVMESFPVQIVVTGPANVIEKLQKMPRR